jgi:hypothetical protein
MANNYSKPLFVCGFPRSGTTVMSKAIQTLDCYKAPKRKVEGHFTYFFAEILQDIELGKINRASVIEDNEYYDIFKKKLSIFLSDFWREISNAGENDYWIEKTPDIRQITAIKQYSEIFPNALYIYMYRDPISCILSNIRTWSLSPQLITSTAERWVESMKEWRKNRNYVRASYIEIFQNNLRNNLEEEIKKLSNFLNLSDIEKESLNTFFLENEINISKQKNLKKTEKKEEYVIEKIVEDEILNWPEIINYYKINNL